MAIPISRYTFVPAERLTSPPSNGGPVEVITDHWWATRDGDLAFYRHASPQCNASKFIAEKVSRGCPWSVELVFHSAIYLPFRDVEVYVDGQFDGVDRRYQFLQASLP